MNLLVHPRYLVRIYLNCLCQNTAVNTFLDEIGFNWDIFILAGWSGLVHVPVHWQKAVQNEPSAASDHCCIAFLSPTWLICQLTPLCCIHLCLASSCLTPFYWPSPIYSSLEEGTQSKMLPVCFSPQILPDPPSSSGTLVYDQTDRYTGLLQQLES